MPKYHPRPRPDPTTLQGMLNEGGDSLVGYLRSIGYRGIVLTKTLSRVFVNAGPRSIRALIGYFDRGVAAAAAGNAAATTKPIRAPAGIGNSNIGEKILYEILIPYTMTGQDRNKHYLGVFRNTAQTGEQLQEIVNDLFAGLAVEGITRSPDFPTGATQTGKIEIIRIQKGG